MAALTTGGKTVAGGGQEKREVVREYRRRWDTMIDGEGEGVGTGE